MSLFKRATPILMIFGIAFILMPSQSKAKTAADCMQVSVHRLNSQIVELVGLNSCSDTVWLKGYLGQYSNGTKCYQGRECKYAFNAKANSKYETKYCMRFEYGGLDAKLDPRTFCAPFKV